MVCDGGGWGGGVISVKDGKESGLSSTTFMLKEEKKNETYIPPPHHLGAPTALSASFEHASRLDAGAGGHFPHQQVRRDHNQVADKHPRQLLLGGDGEVGVVELPDGGDEESQQEHGQQVHEALRLLERVGRVGQGHAQ
jgi:hypothetical protein